MVATLTASPACGDGEADRCAGNTGDWARVTGRPCKHEIS